jgi:hypothetical protein
MSCHFKSKWKQVEKSTSHLYISEIDKNFHVICCILSRKIQNISCVHSFTEKNLIHIFVFSKTLIHFHHPMSKIVVFNAGSSSIKYQVFDETELRLLVNGTVEEIGSPTSHIKQIVHYFDREGNFPKNCSDFRNKSRTTRKWPKIECNVLSFKRCFNCCTSCWYIFWSDPSRFVVSFIYWSYVATTHVEFLFELQFMEVTYSQMRSC